MTQAPARFPGEGEGEASTFAETFAFPSPPSPLSPYIRPDQPPVSTRG